METLSEHPGRLRYLETLFETRQPVSHEWPTAGSDGSVSRAVIVESDRMYAEMLGDLVRSLFGAAAVTVVGSLPEADAKVCGVGADLILAAPAVAGGDVLEYLTRWRRACGCRIVISASQPPAALLAAIAEEPIAGIFDRTPGTASELREGLVMIAGGAHYFSAAIVHRFFDECLAPSCVYASLTATERLVLGVIGDGCDDKAAADRLHMTTRGVKGIRRQLHRKLAVQHRGELQQRAVALGFVMYTPHGCMRPGLTALMAARAMHTERSSDHRRPTRQAA